MSIAQTWYPVVILKQKGTEHGRNTANDRSSGIDGWSIRQLAKSIEAHPSIINYYVGRREDVVHLVIDRVNAEIDLPEYRGDWKPWFKALLEGLRSTLRGYPGVARRLAAVGPGLGESERIINRGIEVLSDAGFGDQAAFVYTILLSQTCAFVATEDDRDKMDDVRKEVGDSYASALSASDPGIAALAKTVKLLTEEESLRRSFFDHQFSVLLDALLSGLEEIFLKG